MPIDCPVEPIPILKGEYHRLDYQAMALVFDVHNDLGCLCDEKIYQSALEQRCRKAGFEALREVPITVKHGRFSKLYLVDLVVERSVLYELKTADAINPQHRQQALNYLFLAGFQYGKLVNMRPPSVQSEFVSTTLTTGDRHQFEIMKDGWMDLDHDSIWLREFMTELLLDWGAFLDVQLFYEALSFFRDGDERFVKPVRVENEGRVLGVQKLRLLSPEIAVTLSALKDSQQSHEKHLRRFLSHTSLRAIHWVNFNRHNIIMKTLKK